jgi:hypothetical protein
VYGSLGGGNVALVPAPAVPQEASANEIKADYELVEKFGTVRAWQVFLDNHPKGFYSDLARAQIERLNAQPQIQAVALSSAPDKPASARDSASKESLEWDKVKDSTDPAELQKFIKRFPDSPLSVNAQKRMDILKQAAQEREDKARAEREAAAKAAEDSRIQAEQKKAEIAAAKKREDDERRAKAAEAEQHARAAEAERKAAEAKQKADEAERNRAAAEAAALRAASEKQAREAEAARKKAELASAQEAACKTQQSTLERLIAKGSEGSGVDDLKTFSRTVTCDRLGPLVVASLDKFNAEAAKRAAVLPNSPELVRSAQTQLVRLGCLTGTIDGALNAPTKSALGHYMTIEGQPSDNTNVTEALVAELAKHTTRVCPLECKTGETAKGETCVATEKPVAPAPAPATASRKNNDEDDARARRKQANREPEASRKPKPAPEVPHVRQQALARPSIISGGGGGGGGGGSSHTMIGVGF